MSVYTVTAERSGKWWVLQADDAPGAISQVARLDQADQIREAIAFVTGEPEDSIEIELRPVLPEQVERAQAQIEQLRELAARFNAEAAAESRQIARFLSDTGLTVRDVGTVLGVSYQRAQQLISEQAALPDRAPLRGFLSHFVEAERPAEDETQKGAPMHMAMDAGEGILFVGELHDDASSHSRRGRRVRSPL